MIKAILDFLTSDEELVSLINYTHKNKRINPYVPHDKTDYPYIVYEISPFLAGQVTTQYRLDITVLSKNVLQIESISSRLLGLLHFRNKPGFIINDRTIYTSKHAGGSGINYDPNQQLFEQVLTFNIKGN